VICIKASESSKGKTVVSMKSRGLTVVQALKIILVLITIGCIAGPIGTVVIMYRNNLSQLVITPQIQQLTHSDNNNSNNNGYNNNNGNYNDINPNSSNPNNNIGNNNGSNGNVNGNNQNNNISNNNNSNDSNNNGDSNNNNNPSGVSPSFLNGQINTAQKTITLTFSITNSLNQVTTISEMGGIVEVTNDQYQLGTVSLQNAPVTISSGQTITVTVSGALTQDGQSHLAQNYKGVTSLDVTVPNGSLTEDGVANQPQPQDLGVVTVN